jgi:serine protease Do
MLHRLAFFVALFTTLALSTTAQEKAKKGKEGKKPKENKIQADQRRFKESDYWVYNDLPAALETAKQTGQPLLVVLRCIP